MMITSVGSLFKALAVVALSLLASMSENSSPAAPVEKAGFVAEFKTAETGPCEVNAQTLCLNGGRFKAQVNWSVPSQGTSGAGTGVALTGDTGYFWFFSSNNIELVIKVVDGRGFNGKFWVFYGALSNVQYSIAITDTTTGAVRTYANPFGSLASVADTAAFDGGTNAVTGEEEWKTEGRTSNVEDPGSTPNLDLGSGLKSSTSGLRPSETSPCVPGDSTLCLNGGRFKVEVGWKVASQGTTGSGRAVPLTGDTGEFWFFSANNIELVIKIVDGTAFNGKFWVFYGALSNVEYKIEVTDTVTGNEKTFVNAAGNLASVADTSGFDTIPTPTSTVPAPTATPTPTGTPTPTPTKSAGIVQVVNVGVNGATAFTDTVSLNSFTIIHVGDSVKWVFPSQRDFHSATSGVCTQGGYYGDDICTEDGNWDSGQLYLGQTFTKQFLTAGSYKYYCQVHKSMMTGTVQVVP
jgi:plastocyanin